jgi:hypothetical protein
VKVWTIALFVVAAAGVDQNGQSILLDQETLHVDD